MMSRLAVVLLVWLATLGPLAAAEAVFPAGSHIGLVPPAGMQPSQTFPGFEDRERKSGILINELPGPAYEQFLKSMSSGAINLPGVSNAKREILLTDGGAAHLVTGEQEADGTRFRKWLLISRRTVTSHDTDLSFSFVVTAQVPLDASEVYSDEAIRKSLGTIALRAAVPPEEVLAQMPFKLSEMGRFDTVRALIPGRAIILTEGAAGIETMQRPYLMISIGSGAPSQADQRGEFAQNVLRNIQGFRNLRMTYAEAIRIGGQPGYEIRLEGQSEINNSDVIVVQWLRFAGSAFLRLVGVTPKAQWGDSFPRFRAVRDGIAPR